MTKRYLLLLLLLVALPVLVGQAQDRTLVDLRDLEPREGRMEAFTLDARQDLYVEAVGARSREDRWETWWNDDDWRERWRWRGEAWILDARTREVVWTLRDADTDERRGVHTFEGTVTLPPGAYEAYYASYAGTSTYWGDWDTLADRIGDAIDRAFSRRDRRDRREPRYGGEFVDNGAYEDFRLVIQGDGQPLSRIAVERLRDAFNETAVVSLTGLWDDTYQEAGFILHEPTDLELYAIGEARGDESYDYGWILDADTRERIWVLDYRHSDHAGGSDKNRVVRDVLSLPAGRYAAFFVTDDSHSPEEWNAVPAYDPDFWGLTLRVKRPADKARVELFDYEHVPDSDAIVSLIGLGEDELVSRGFTLKQPMDVRIYALGEGDHDEMYDYGWIIDANTRQRVWEMGYYDTDHAGGAQKNRLADTVVSLDAGDYVVYYATDGSHDYSDWNAARPIDGQHWGITLLPAQGALDRRVVDTYAEREAPNVLAQIIHVRDHEYERARFSLDRPTRVRVYALGEGDRDEMYDYGWIEDEATGRAVWEMTYRMTDRAGGARKNRRFDDTILLDAGDYVVYYKTDGSHAFNDWNATPPADPMQWGITVYRTDD